MTREELLALSEKFKNEADLMGDVTVTSATTTTSNDNVENPSLKNETDNTSDTSTDVSESKIEINENDEIEEPKQIEPQTNGEITDDITTDTTGVEQVLTANLDERFASMLKNYTDVKAELDKMKVVLSEILTRIDLVQEVTDKVTTVDTDSLLTDSIKFFI